MFNFGYKGLFSLLSSVLKGGWSSVFYLYSIVLLFLVLFSLRVPYFFSYVVLAGFVAIWVFPLFISLLASRVGVLPKFVVSFMPKGCPWYVVPFIFWVELVSYLIRSMVLILRPVVNLAFGGLLMVIMYFYWEIHGYGGLIVVFLSYEGCVLLVHWFIVYQVLKFSQNS